MWLFPHVSCTIGIGSGFELDRKNPFANFLLENLKEISVLKSGNTACEKQNGGCFVANLNS
jgi:hypothetical protein